MPPFLIALASGVGLFAAARVVQREMRRIGKALDRSAKEPRPMGTLTPGTDGVYRPPAKPRP